MVAVMTVVGILWIPVVQNVQGGQLFIYIQAVSAYFSPPIACLYLMSVFWTKVTEKGAFWGMIIGFVVGLVRMILDFTYQAPRCGKPDKRPSITKDLHYMYFALVLFWITCIAIVVISLLTKPSEGANTARLTWWTRYDDSLSTDLRGTNRDKEITLDNLNKAARLTKMTDQDDNEDVEKANKGKKGATSDEMKLSEEKALSSDDSKSDITTVLDAKPSPIKRFYNWFCGYEEGSEEAKKAAVEQQQRMSTITSLKQDPCAKILLQVNVVIILCIGLTLYIYFSV